MTHYVGLRYGSDTIALSTGDNILAEYPVQAARMGPGGSYEIVSEQIRFTVRGASTAAAQNAWEAIGRFISYVAERKANGEGEKLYIELQPDGDSTRWRSEILEAVPVPSREVLTLWANKEISGAIEIVREPFFWGNRTAVSLSNRYNAGTTSQIRIDNRQDSTHDCFVEIAGSQIDGELPTPAEIYLQQDDTTGGTGRNYGRFYIGVNAFADPTSFEPVLEAEDMTGVADSTTASTSMSGGVYSTVTVGSAFSKVYPKWTVPAAWADAFRGRYVKLLVKFLGKTSNWVVQPVVYEYNGLQELFVGRPRQIVNSNGLVDLGLVPIPPSPYASDMASQQLGLILYHDGSNGASSYIQMDYLFLMPTDSGRTILQRGMFIPDGDYMLFDEIEGVFVSNESGLKHPIYTPQGPGTMLFPGRDQRVYILHGRDSTAEGADLKSVQIWYRPRRLTV